MHAVVSDNGVSFDSWQVEVDECMDSHLQGGWGSWLRYISYVWSCKQVSLGSPYIEGARMLMVEMHAGSLGASLIVGGGSSLKVGL